MAQDKTPSDKELDALALEISDYDDPAYFRRMARAVLAKWGSPVVAGEHLNFPAQEPLGEPFQRVLDDNRWELYAEADTPQPTQAQAGAVPLTVDEIEQLIAQWSYELHGDRARYLVRMTEIHHGIKGGQHG